MSFRRAVFGNLADFFRPFFALRHSTQGEKFMARLNVMVEAACKKGLGVTGYDAKKGPIVDEDAGFLSIYVTDENREPVTGLKQNNFKLHYLVPPGWGNPGVFVFFNDADLGIPGVYIFKLSAPILAYGTTFGVQVKASARRGRPAEEGFGMSTAIKV
jgi:hypothetical protein